MYLLYPWLGCQAVNLNVHLAFDLAGVGTGGSKKIDRIGSRLNACTPLVPKLVW